jgi:hypothetical protein
MTFLAVVLVLVCVALIANGRRHCRLIREGKRPRK